MKSIEEEKNNDNDEFLDLFYQYDFGSSGEQKNEGSEYTKSPIKGKQYIQKNLITKSDSSPLDSYSKQSKVQTQKLKSGIRSKELQEVYDTISELKSVIPTLNKIGPRSDNHKSIQDYTIKYAYLDKMARILSSVGKDPCTAVTFVGNNSFILSGNTSLDQNNIRPIIATIKAINDALSGKGNLFNIVSASNALSKRIKFFEASILTNNKIKLTPECIKSFNLFKKSCADQKLSYSEYKQFLDSMFECSKHDDLSKDVPLGFVRDDYLYKDVPLGFVRIVKDVKELLEFFTKKGFNNISVDIIKNPSGLHAEMNIQEYCANNKLPIDYIGISLLSCYLCQNELDMLHRGNHGNLFFGGWGVSEDMIVKKTLLAKLSELKDKKNELLELKKANDSSNNMTHDFSFDFTYGDNNYEKDLSALLNVNDAVTGQDLEKLVGDQWYLSECI